MKKTPSDEMKLLILYVLLTSLAYYLPDGEIYW